MWPGAVLPKADDLVQVSSPEEAANHGLPVGPRGLEEHAYNVGS